MLSLILSNNEDTVLVQGEMGSAKSALLPMLGERLPNHRQIYLDCNNMGVEDMFVPNFKTIDAQGVVSMVPNELLGLHLQQPVILMIDEYGKGGEGLKNGLTRIMNEHEVNGYKLHKDSIRDKSTYKNTESFVFQVGSQCMRVHVWRAG